MRLRWQMVAAYLAAQLFYLLTLAPTVLWADDARYQVQAFVGDLTFRGAYDHPVWVLFAYPFAQLPFGEVAARASFVTSLWAALAVAFTYGSLRLLTRTAWAAAVGAGALAVSHNFWMHAVRTEVYSLNVAMFAIALFALLQPRLSRRWFALAGVALALAIVNHIMMLIGLAGLGAYALWRMIRERIPVGVWIWSAVGFAATLGVLYLILRPEFSAAFIPQGERIELSRLPRELLFFSVLFGLQFPSPALMLVFVGAILLLRKNPALFAVLALIAAANIVAVMTRQELDKFAFYYLAYYVAALAAGIGAAWLVEWLGSRPVRTQRAARATLLAAVLVMPVLIYQLLPPLLNGAGIDAAQFGIREVPGRPSWEYYLNPSRRNYQGARWFAEGALNMAEPNAVIITDYPLATPLLYMQQIEHLRSDVEVAVLEAAEQTDFALDAAPQRPIYLAHTERGYDIEGLRRYFDIEPAGPIFALRLRQTGAPATE